MKKIIYVCLLVLLAVSFGCEKENLNEENFESNNRVELDSNFQKNGFGDDNGNIEDTYHLYVDMDYIEANYSGLYNGPFRDHFQNEMSNYFSIYLVEFADPSCGNVERWTVNKAEYDAYVALNGPFIGFIVIENNGSTDGSTSSNGSNNNDDSGWGDEDGNTTKKKKPIQNNDPNEPTSTEVPVQYENCF